mgnify:CR=1 FL=1
MPSVWLRIFSLLLILSTSMVARVHLPVVQLVGWVTMYQRFAEEMAPREAVAVIFSGKRPCAHCLYVRSALDAEENARQALSRSLQKEIPLVLISAAPLRVAEEKPRPRWPFPAPESARALDFSPESPPPRQV